MDIYDIQHSDRGNYTCSVENTYGKDEITYVINVRGNKTIRYFKFKHLFMKLILYILYLLVPPPPPKLTVYLEEIDSLQLKWTDTAESDTPILGKTIYTYL